MLKIVLNPDAAYEICTVFAPDCEYQSRLNHNSSSNEEYYEDVNEKDSDEYDRNFHETINTINVFRSTENPVRMNKIK